MQKVPLSEDARILHIWTMPTPDGVRLSVDVYREGATPPPEGNTSGEAKWLFYIPMTLDEAKALVAALQSEIDEAAYDPTHTL